MTLSVDRTMYRQMSVMNGEDTEGRGFEFSQPDKEEAVSGSY